MNTALQDAIAKLNYGDRAAKIEALQQLEEQGIPALLNKEVLNVVTELAPLKYAYVCDDQRWKEFFDKLALIYAGKPCYSRVLNYLHDNHPAKKELILWLT